MVDGATLVAGWSEELTGNPLLTSAALIIGLVALAWFAFVNNWWRLLGPALAVPLILLVGLDSRPDTLVADTTQAVALRTEAGMGLISGKTGSFATDVWSDHYQESIAEMAGGTHCDSLGCVAETARFSVAAIRNPAAFAEDCGLHDLIIARVRAPATWPWHSADRRRCTRGGWGALAAVERCGGAVRYPHRRAQSHPALASRATVTPAAGMPAEPIT
ncbi:MAG: hypothetical protein WBA73_02580 [Devosia sp.]